MRVRRVMGYSSKATYVLDLSKGCHKLANNPDAIKRTGFRISSNNNTSFGLELNQTLEIVVCTIKTLAVKGRGVYTYILFDCTRFIEGKSNVVWGMQRVIFCLFRWLINLMGGENCVELLRVCVIFFLLFFTFRFYLGNDVFMLLLGIKYR